MADRKSDRAGRGTQHDLVPLAPDRIRNVVLVGPQDGGKTTLLEALLLHSGAINRAGTVEAGTTVSDHEETEQARGRSTTLSVAPLLHPGPDGPVKINFLDTPGYADFAGEVRAGLRAAEAALFVVPAHGTVDEGTRQLWRECREAGTPSAVVVTRLDHARADVDAITAQVREAFGERVLPAYATVRDGSGQVTALEHLLSPAAEVDGEGRWAEDRHALVEAIVEEAEDEGLMDRYLEGEEVSESALLADVDRAMAAGAFHPLVPVCATTGVGCAELLDLVVAGFPTPRQHPSPEVFTPAGKTADPITGDPDGPLVAEVVHTTSDPYVGRVSVVRVFSGTLRPDQQLHVSGHFSSFFGDDVGHADHDEDERAGTLAHPFGRHLLPAPQLVAGDIGCVSRLTTAETGDTLSSPEEPRVLKPWSLPDPQLPVAIEAATRSDEDKLSSALARIAAEDPSLRVERNPETHQVVLWVLGEAHAELALARLEQRYGVHVEQRDLVVPLRETLAKPAQGHGRHVKQSGGHGQYAVCDVEVEPLPQGGGFEFADRVVGGAVPRQFIPSVEKGVRAQMEKGVHGFPMVDLKVTLTDGKAHSVDSSDMAFQAAGGLALREAAEAAGVVLLEPYDEVEVLVPDEHLGEVMSDLSARRGRLHGTDTVADGRSIVRAAVPQTELVRYAIDLRSATHGAGTFTRRFGFYEPMPPVTVARG